MGKAILRVLLLAALAASCCCSPSDFLTRRLAFDLIASSGAVRAPLPFLLHTGLVSNQEYLSTDELVLRRHGWISATSAKCSGEVTPPPCWEVALSPSGVETVRSLIPSGASTQESFEIPVARRQIIAITGISKQGSSAEVEFLWRWSPLNELGAALYPADLRYHSVVAFRSYDDGWRVSETTIRSNQTIEESLKNAEPAP